VNAPEIHRAAEFAPAGGLGGCSSARVPAAVVTGQQDRQDHDGQPGRTALAPRRRGAVPDVESPRRGELMRRRCDHRQPRKYGGLVLTPNRDIPPGQRGRRTWRSQLPAGGAHVTPPASRVDSVTSAIAEGVIG